MTSLLPVVTDETATASICDILLEGMDGDPDKCILIDWVLQVADENPGVLRAANMLFEDSPEREKSAGLMGMAIAYRTLSAQAEIAALEKLAGPAEPFADILQQFEAQALANYRALNGIQTVFPRADFQQLCRTDEPDHSAPEKMPAGPYDCAGAD